MPTLPQIGEHWAGLRIDGELGRGGFGRVFRAWDPSTERHVALKVLDTQDLSGEARDRFVRESRIAGGLEHPRIVPIYGAGQQDGQPYIVMRLVDGGTLADEIEAGPMSLGRIVSVITQVAEALDRAHSDGLIHRDVKPANILCARGSDDVYLSDFGITRAIDERSSERLTQVGLGPATVSHAAPEQLSGDPLTPAADIYALACVLYQCLVGAPPFNADTPVAVMYQHVHEPPPRASESRAGLGSAVDAVVARGLAKAPADRFASCRGLAASLADAVGDVRPAASSTQPLPPMPEVAETVFRVPSAVAPEPGPAPAAAASNQPTRADLAAPPPAPEPAKSPPAPAPSSGTGRRVGAAIGVFFLFWVVGVAGFVAGRAIFEDGGGTDAGTPSSTTLGPAELTGLIPDQWRDTCSADDGLSAVAGVTAARECRPVGQEALTVSYAAFDDRAAMDEWIDERTVDVLSDLNPAIAELDRSAGACRRSGRDYAEVAGYEATESGDLLCFVNRNGRNVIFWTRNDALIGSIATSESADSDIADLVDWWDGVGSAP